MNNFDEVIEILIKDLKQKGISRVAQDMNLQVINKAISLKMLSENFMISEEGVAKNDGEINDIESVTILNAALSKGDDMISPEWKSYDKFSGTRGHADHFKKMIEGKLAGMLDAVILIKNTIIDKYDAKIEDNAGGSDLAFTFTPFPNIKFFCQLYLADDEFPAEAKLYFSANADKYMPAQCLEQLAMLWIKQLQKLVIY